MKQTAFSVGIDSGQAGDGEPEQERRVSEHIFRALTEVVQQRGVSPDALLGPSAASLHVGLSLSLTQLDAVFVRASELVNDPAFGLHCGLQASDASYGLMTPLVAHAPTLRHGLLLVTQFHQLLLQDVRIRLSEYAGQAELRLEFMGDPGRTIVEFFVAGLTRCVRAFGCGPRDIQAVCFEHARPGYHPVYTAAFAGAERFKHAFSGVVFSAEALDRPNLHHEASLQKLVLAEAEARLKQLWRPRTWTEQVRNLLNKRAPAQLTDMACAARDLGLSERSLRRRLEDEGTSFRDLSQSLLHESARSMLRNPGLTLQSIAQALGFSDCAAFHRAFRRWDGCTPAAFRASFLEQPDS